MVFFDGCLQHLAIAQYETETRKKIEKRMVERIHSQKKKLEPRKGLAGTRARELFFKAGMKRPAPMASCCFRPPLQGATVRADFTHGNDFRGAHSIDRALGIHIECA